MNNVRAIFCKVNETPEKMEKPAILSDEEVNKWLEKQHGKLDIYTKFTVSHAENRAAQRDADTAYYEPLIQQAEKDAMRRHQSWLANVKGWRNSEQIKELLEQANTEVAREIFKKIESLPYMNINPEGRMICINIEDWRSLKSKYGGQK